MTVMLTVVVPGDQKVSVHQMITGQKNTQKYFQQFKPLATIKQLELGITKNTFRRVNKCLENGGGHYEHYL
jgi:uncharacterized protein YerC